MNPSDFTTTLLIDQSPEEVFNTINDVDRWWTENLEGDSHALNDEFTVHFPGIHVSTQKVVTLLPAKKIVWEVTDSNLSSFEDKQEWTGTTIHFDIAPKGDKTQLQFTHIGLVPDVQCYDSCTQGWTYFIDGSLFKLFTEGNGQPNKLKAKSEIEKDQIKLKITTMTPNKTTATTEQVAARFDELAQQEKWFDIHDELFADNVNSLEPINSPYFKNAEGKAAVRKKGEDWVAKVQEFYGATTTHPVIGGNHFAVGRSFDIKVEGFGRITIEELMVYEVKDGQIVVEQFFY